MILILARNVNEAFVRGVRALACDGQQGSSRVGPVITMPWPVVTIYTNPTERVLFDETRDANPFFHMFESLWMLAGRRDAISLNNYVSDFGLRFGQYDGTVHGAYGHRWMSGMGFDQLTVVVERLRRDPNDRQCVIQMWDSSDEGANDLLGDWKDRPCNTHVYLRVRQHRDLDYVAEVADHPVLDLTVLCRSNDIVWGAYGANAVHFSVLQEYLAGRIGCGIGKLYQFSNNYHGYLDSLEKLGDPDLLTEHDPYESGEVYSVAMADDWNSWDNDLHKFMRWHDWLWSQTSEHTDITVGVANQADNGWFRRVPVPMAQCRWLWKRGRRDEAIERSKAIEAPDWRVACQQWMQRRVK